MNPTTGVHNTLHNIVPLWEGISAEVRRHREAERDAIQAAVNAGEMLNEAKELCSHGEWLPRLASIPLNPRTAQRWMRLSCIGVKCDLVSHLGGIDATLRLWAKMPAGATVEDFEERLFENAVHRCQLMAMEWAVAELDFLIEVHRSSNESYSALFRAMDASPTMATDEIKKALAECDLEDAANEVVHDFVVERGKAITAAVHGLRVALPKGREAVFEALDDLRTALPQLAGTRSMKLLDMRSATEGAKKS